MKAKSYYLYRLAKENIIYILSFISIIVALFFSIFFYIKKSSDNSVAADTLKTDIKELKAKVDLIKLKGKLKNEGIDIDSINKLLLNLVPEEEDYFSIVTALEKISLETNFFITEYIVNLNKSKSTNISMTIYGLGNNDAFLNFLKNYNFAGGRLIAINEIDFSSKTPKGNKLNLNFYSGKSTISDISEVRITEKDKEMLRKIRDKVRVEVSFTPVTTDLNYPTKNNPF